MASGNDAELNKQSEPARWLAAYMVEAMVAIHNNYAVSSPYKRGEIQGRITLEALLIIVPLTKAIEAAQLSKADFLTQLKEVEVVKNDEQLSQIFSKVIDLVNGTKPPPLIKGLTTEGNPLVLTKVPPPVPAAVAGPGIGALNERWLGAAVMETAQGIAVDEGLGIKLSQVVAIPAEGAEKARIVQNFLIGLVPDAFATAAGAQGASVAEAQRVLSELMKVKHWRQVLANKNVFVVIGDVDEGAEVAIVGGKAGILQGHHIIEDSMIPLLRSWGYTALDEAQVPVKVLTRPDHIGKSGLHLKMWYEWENGVRTSRMTQLNPLRMSEFENAEKMMNALIEFYDANDYGDLAKVTRAWCRANGVPFTK